jgi:hypothetical protein
MPLVQSSHVVKALVHAHLRNTAVELERTVHARELTVKTIPNPAIRGHVNPTGAKRTIHTDHAHAQPLSVKQTQANLAVEVQIVEETAKPELNVHAIPAYTTATSTVARIARASTRILLLEV